MCVKKAQIIVKNRDEGFLWNIMNSEGHSAEPALRFPIYFTPLCNWTHPHDQIFNNGSSVSKISGIDPRLYTKLVFRQPGRLFLHSHKSCFELMLGIKAEIFLLNPLHLGWIIGYNQQYSMLHYDPTPTCNADLPQVYSMCS